MGPIVGCDDHPAEGCVLAVSAAHFAVFASSEISNRDCKGLVVYVRKVHRPFTGSIREHHEDFIGEDWNEPRAQLLQYLERKIVIHAFVKYHKREKAKRKGVLDSVAENTRMRIEKILRCQDPIVLRRASAQKGEDILPEFVSCGKRRHHTRITR